MLTITEVLALIKDGKLDGAAITPNLEESEGKQGSVHVGSTGHPLQHIAVLNSTAPGTFNYLKTDYHARGPVKYTATGVKKDQHIKAHSQFSDETQAANFIAMALSSKGGVKALKILKDPKYTVQLTYGLPVGIQVFERSTQMFAPVTDPSNPPAQNFVLFLDIKATGLVLELHQSNKILEGLHFQSAYPIKTGAPAAGACDVVVTEYPGKTKHTYHFSA